MAEVTFNEEPQYQVRSSLAPSFLINLVYKAGLAKTNREAEKVLLIVAVAAAALAVVVFVTFLRTSPAKHPAPPPDPAHAGDIHYAR